MKFSIVFLMMTLVVTTSCSKAELNDEVLTNTVVTSLDYKSNVAMEMEIFELINNYRESKGLSVLKYNSGAQAYTVNHNLYMISNDEINHDDFDQRSSQLSVELNATKVAENVGRSFSTAEGVFNAWLASTSHLKNIEGDYNETAISVAYSEEGILYFTQVFIKE